MAKRRARLNDENDPLSSTDKVLAGFEQLSQSASQPDDKLTSQQVSNTTSQPADKSRIRKATFQLSEAVLQQLDKFHLQLQLELGKSSAPYKEVIVEEAIAQFLEQAGSNRDELLKALRSRQERRQ
ncbi:hypothetical protein H6F98_00490 [Microcoleus sp. FACHB-SPT15]|uniref:hypothetical protein n=1 Tax=Microcoleus sp. FACHB-SPT15 TaxID=2692830 RepID=UPI00177AAC89|nr:hypothetical protein [Microcoleus sp. FACHB-SPT15]MBD1803956.1 hypothetical protein [Microcoleus sp. FACHB-SPT15]